MATDYPLQQLEHSPPGAPLPPDGEQPNGQHHLLRHVLSPEQCSDALRHFGTTDSKAAARMVNRMSQRDLRDMFQRVRGLSGGGGGGMQWWYLVPAPPRRPAPASIRDVAGDFLPWLASLRCQVLPGLVWYHAWSRRHPPPQRTLVPKEPYPNASCSSPFIPHPLNLPSLPPSDHP